ncbi:MAG: hypothetical protein KZQ77_17220 [Candidatus Thiodiazotropha sp. (ex Notomyrtea botanica)]|nr:hypothetical protein [Candidatus Thiodiazotropha sp. (ex Notomyrtea botanica)]
MIYSIPLWEQQGVFSITHPNIDVNDDFKALSSARLDVENPIFALHPLYRDGGLFRVEVFNSFFVVICSEH